MQLSIFLRYKKMAVGKTTAFYLQLFLSEVSRLKNRSIAGLCLSPNTCHDIGRKKKSTRKIAYHHCVS